MTRITPLLIAVFVSLTLEASTQRRIEEVDLSRLLGRYGATFVLAEPGGRLRIHNLARARERFIPASTFKIPNSLIALDSKVAPGPRFAMKWDPKATPPKPFWPDAWKRDQTLETAFRHSAYWYFQELARRTGEKRMRGYLDRFAYGNQSMEGGLDRFWLEGGLRISAIEQITFLEHFYFGRLGVSPAATATVKKMMLLRETPAWRLGGKTGTAELTAAKELGWIVGYLEKGKDVYFYALNFEGDDVWERWPPQKRQELVLSILGYLRVTA